MGRDHWSAARYGETARFVSDLAGPALALLAPQAGERILDLGCGDGALTAQIAGSGAVVVGVDSSPDMVAEAQARGLDARLMDGAALSFQSRFDAVFSNAALHWMTDPEAVIDGVARHLAPGGRFVGEFGGFGNVATIRTAIIAVLSRHYGVETDLKGVWYFPTAAEHRARLERAGFSVESIGLHPRPTPLESGLEAWLEVLAAPALAFLSNAEAAEARRRVAALCAPALRDESGAWTGDYVRLRFSAAKR